MFFLMLGICLESLNSPLERGRGVWQSLTLSALYPCGRFLTHPLPPLKRGECHIKTLRHLNQNASTFRLKRLGVFKICRGEFLFCRSVSGHFKKVANLPSQVSRLLNLLINRSSAWIFIGFTKIHKFHKNPVWNLWNLCECPKVHTKCLI